VIHLKKKNLNNAITLSFSCNPDDKWVKLHDVARKISKTGAPIGDNITVADILNISCINLDQNDNGEEFKDIMEDEVQEILRIRGITIIVSIRYDNMINFDERVSYNYRARAIDVFEKPVEIFPIIYGLKRMVRERSGLRINFLFTGELGKKNYRSLFSKIGSYISLIAIVSIILFVIRKFIIHCYPCYCPERFTCCSRNCPECYSCCSEYHDKLDQISTLTEEEIELGKKKVMPTELPFLLMESDSNN